jgi:uncharacterized protein
MKPDAEKKLDPELRGKARTCREILNSLGTAVVAFSGGVDSTLLLSLSVEALGPENVLAAIGVSPSLPARELEAARQFAHQIGLDLVELHTEELSDPEYLSNPANRCYYCKRELFTRLRELADQKGYNAILSGANADDRGDFRPGLNAGKELGVLTPLLAAGLTKADVRVLSRVMDLPTWDKPAMACLASRIPYGRAITPETLSRVERAEYLLKDLGFTQCRVRDHGTLGRIEVPQEDIIRLTELRDPVLRGLKSLGYTYISLDLQGFRSGAMNEVLRKDETQVSDASE